MFIVIAWIGIAAGVLFLVSPLLVAASVEPAAAPEPSARPSWAVIPREAPARCECGAGFVPPF